MWKRTDSLRLSSDLPWHRCVHPPHTHTHNMYTHDNNFKVFTNSRHRSPLVLPRLVKTWVCWDDSTHWLHGRMAQNSSLPPRPGLASLETLILLICILSRSMVVSLYLCALAQEVEPRAFCTHSTSELSQHQKSSFKCTVFLLVFSECQTRKEHGNYRSIST